jgi:hypothetical protein
MSSFCSQRRVRSNVGGRGCQRFQQSEQLGRFDRFCDIAVHSGFETLRSSRSEFSPDETNFSLVDGIRRIVEWIRPDGGIQESTRLKPPSSSWPEVQINCIQREIDSDYVSHLDSYSAFPAGETDLIEPYRHAHLGGTPDNVDTDQV